MDRIVELEIPARPEFVSVVRMALGALAGVRPGLTYERADDLRIVVSEACSSAVEAIRRNDGDATGRPARLRVRAVDGSKSLEIRITAPAGAFESAFPATEPDGDGDLTFRIALIRALVDDVELATSPTGESELRLVLHREEPEES